VTASVNAACADNSSTANESKAGFTDRSLRKGGNKERTLTIPVIAPARHPSWRGICFEFPSQKLCFSAGGPAVYWPLRRTRARRGESMSDSRRIAPIKKALTGSKAHT
jgi:hypothetical protein